jgi:hypothetical protein
MNTADVRLHKCVDHAALCWQQLLTPFSGESIKQLIIKYIVLAKVFLKSKLAAVILPLADCHCKLMKLCITPSNHAVHKEI